MKDKEYYFRKDMTPDQVIAALDGLRTDALEKSKEHSHHWLTTENEKHFKCAVHYEAQREILQRLLWSFTGEAEEEGCKPFVSIY